MLSLKRLCLPNKVNNFGGGAMSKSKTDDNTHFLYGFKKALDDVFGYSPKLNVCIEAAHPTSMGRPSKLIMRLLMSKRFLEDPAAANQEVEFHFIPDRLSVPKLDGHVLAIGGPRSNVISRIAMEYETEFQSDSPFYRRYGGLTFPLEYTHVHRRDYGGRLFADMASLDPTAISLIYHYFEMLQKPLAKERNINLYSLNRHLHRRFLIEKTDANDRGADDSPIDPTMATHKMSRLPSLSATIENHGRKDFVIYDHFVETILPNVFSKNWDKHALIICHGLRDLGAYAAFCQLENRKYLNRLKDRLDHIRGQRTEIDIAGATQTGWSVFRPLEARPEMDGIVTGDEKSWRDQFDEILPRFKRVKWSNGEDFYICEHKSAPVPPEPVCKSDVIHLQEAIESRHYDSKERSGPSFKIDQINEQQILDAMSVPRDSHFRRHEIYALGCFEQKKTVYTQQTRALTLIHALYKARKITKGTKVAIVGGGVSGMTAAIAAAKTGARVVMCEQGKSLIPLQRKCSHRWLHPYFYDWPSASSNSNRSDLPIEALNWNAGNADGVFKDLIDQFKRFRKQHNQDGDNREITDYSNFPVRMVMYDSVNGKHIISKRALKWDKASKSMALSDDPDVQGDAFLNMIKVRDGKSDGITYRNWIKEWKTKAAQLVRQIRTDNAKKTTKHGNARDIDRLEHDEFVECDVLIFATGFGEEANEVWHNGKRIDFGDKLLNKTYWKADTFPVSKECEPIVEENDEDEEDENHSNSQKKPIYVVSGAGDGALIDILRLCVKEFEDSKWHGQFVRQMSEMIEPDKNGAIWSNRRDVLIFAYELRRLFRSDRFRLEESEKLRLSLIERTMIGFDIDAFLDEFNIQLNNVEVYNVDMQVQPFWANASVAHQLLIWCLHKKGKLRFIRGTIEAYGPVNAKDVPKKTKVLTIRRYNTSKPRYVVPSGIIIRHGVGDQPSQFLDIQGLLIDMPRSAKEIAADAKRLVSLLKLSNQLHPETEKFFRHTVNHLN